MIKTWRLNSESATLHFGDNIAYDPFPVGHNVQIIIHIQIIVQLGTWASAPVADKYESSKGGCLKVLNIRPSSRMGLLKIVSIGYDDSNIISCLAFQPKCSPKGLWKTYKASFFLAIHKGNKLNGASNV